MMNIEQYLYASTLDEADRCLTAEKGNTVLGGCGYLRMGTKQITTAIDLSKLQLDYIHDTGHQIEIGAMTPLRKLETDPNLTQTFNDILGQSVKDIVGVQLRNLVTVGGTVAGRYPFSDLITALMALNTCVKFVNKEAMPLDDYMNGKSVNGVLEKIIIKKESITADFQSMRNSQTDYAILNVAVSRVDGIYKVVVGARPQKAIRVTDAETYLNQNTFTTETATTAGLIAAEVLTFGDNLRGSAAYRKALCPALIKRALMAVNHAN